MSDAGAMDIVEVFLVDRDELDAGTMSRVLREALAFRAEDADAMVTTADRVKRIRVARVSRAVSDAAVATARHIVPADCEVPFAIIDPAEARHCLSCDRALDSERVRSGNRPAICGGCLVVAAAEVGGSSRGASPARVLAAHFAGTGLRDVVTSRRLFRYYLRADVDAAACALFEPLSRQRVGVHQPYSTTGLTFQDLVGGDPRDGTRLAPLMFEDIDTGEPEPRPCARTSLWLGESEGSPFAALLHAYVESYREPYVTVEIAVAPGDAGRRLVERSFTTIESAVEESRVYRGKVLSLEASDGHTGEGVGLRVHRLQPVSRNDLVLPEGTIQLIDRNVIEFAARRAQLKARGLSGKKGLLFWGPPGTGKTHTVRYLAGCLPGHTTLLVTAEQQGLIGEYFALARLLQPAIVVLEDVDLIARDRGASDNSCDQVLLNKLLNEMDGLKEEADVFCILTTNRPEMLETALADRPGRIDQAIEFPVPDAEGRRRLVTLYAGSVQLAGAIIDEVVARTAGSSAAFIKELMRRAAQSALERSPRARIKRGDLEVALDEMLFAGGRLNRRLLGGAAADADA